MSFVDLVWKISDALNWTSDSSVGNELRSRLVEGMEQRVSALGDETLIDALRLLPVDARKRFLRAPSIVRALQNGESGRELVVLSLAAELAASQLPLELPNPMWTARGDVLIDADGAILAEAQSRSLAGITLDERSDLVFPDCEYGIGPTRHHDPVELEQLRLRLSQAIATLQEFAPRACAFVRENIEVLALRREVDEATTFHSSSFSGFPGLIRFANAHVDHATTAVFMEALVHEAIHSLLYVFEEVHGAFLREAQANQRAIQSPWTGRIIRLQSYVHACAVWYGVYGLWEQAARNGFPDANRLAARAAAGFGQKPYSGQLREQEAPLSDAAIALLRTLEERMESALTT